MNDPAVNVLRTARLGVARGGIELRHTYSYWPDLAGNLFIPLLQLGVLLLMRDRHVPGTTFSLGSATLPGGIGMGLALGGMFGVAALLSSDREDGTLLRAKATPGGMSAYVIGKLTLTSATALTGVAVGVTAGVIGFPGVQVSAAGLATLAWVTGLGLLSTIPVGIIIGSVLPGARFMPLFLFPFAGLVAISGIFYPVTHLPGWLQATGQVFPLYWLGLGDRAALLPPGFAAVEIDGSWRLPLVFGVLALWSVLGLAAAPVLLRRMARRESGSRVAARRERAMLRPV
jgi:ABC-2 type transport system permease protein